jgi:hypothetical protein
MVGILNSQRFKKKKYLTVIEAFNLALSIKKELLQNDTFINLRSSKSI